MAKYIDPLTDFSFKKIFGSEPNKDLLIAFLNEVFQGRKHIVNLVYNKNEHAKDTKHTGGAIFDLTCTGDKGEKFLIEVQRSSQANLKQRMLYYASKLIADQAPRGKRKEWDYAITEVYVIVLVDGFAIPGTSECEYVHDICLCFRNTGKVLYEELGFFYIELVNFVKDEAALETDLDRWLYVLKNISKLNKIPLFLRKPVFQKLFEVAEYSNLTKEEQQMYDVELKRKWDNAAVLDYAKKEAMKQGREQGIQQGIQQGLQQGIQQGKEEGKEESRKEVVTNLLTANRSRLPKSPTLRK